MLIIRDRAHMSIGNTFSITHRIVSPYVTDPSDLRYTAWKHGNGYNYGMLPPRYPVPALYYGEDNPQYHEFRMKFDARYGKR